ncbi:PREDICTED: UPF0481 protein At3g47200-like [Prunus mume]|uniref:UPF0481 protein At3g47200-like n=1 Tax=Prunus mume TaxID=102107 RepID=A0ABM0PMV7_PRUMU|nr:PREDICTED: UPF0481 protein At3g47200-like [Prunus mume]
MNSQSSSPTANGGRDHAVITIAATTNIQTTPLDQRIQETRWRNESCCIFKVRQCLVEINKKTYQPHIVSCGPYHYGDQHLEMIQQHKWKYLRDLLARTPSNGPTLDHYRQVVAAMEEEIRGCYSETISLSSDGLVEMMVLDGLFTIQLFYKLKRFPPAPSHDHDQYDPIFDLKFLFANIIRDLFRLENQFPFSLLQKLFDESKASRGNSDSSSLSKLALQFFNYAFQRPDQVLDQDFSAAGEVKHLLDLLRWSFIPKPYDHSPQEKPRPQIESIQSAEKLRLAGIKFKTREAMTFIDIRFCNGLLEIPHIVLDDLCTDLLMNFVAFEQCYTHRSKHFTTYAAFMSCLIRTPADVSFLCDKKIVENYLGTDEEVVHFFKNLGKDVPLDIGEGYLWKLFKDVNEYHRNMWHVRWEGFRFKYFGTPWSFLSALAAVIILLLTAIQAFCAVYEYALPPELKKH